MKLEQFLEQYRIETQIRNDIDYKQVTVSKYSGIKLRGIKNGSKIGRKRQFLIDLEKYPNTLIFTRQGLLNGSLGLASKEVHNCVLTENMPTLSVNTDIINVNFLKYLIRSNFFLNKIKELTVVGSAQKSIHERDFLKIDIDIPSIDEQKKIVKKISLKSKFFILLKDEIHNQNQLISELKQSILHEAIQGNLTKDWREENQNIEPASVLLERVKAEKEQLIADKKIKKEKTLPSIKKEEIPFELPDKWVWCRLGEITNYGSSKKIDYNEIESKTWVLDLEDIEKNSSKIIQFKSFEERPSTSTKSVFSKGWVLYSKLRPYLDKVVVAPKDGVCTTEILPLPIYDKIDSYFLMYSLKINSFLNYVNSKVSGMKMPRLKTNDGRMALIPIAPEVEQKIIVEKVKLLMEKFKHLEKEIKISEANAEMLMQSVLQEAFNNQ